MRLIKHGEIYVDINGGIVELPPNLSSSSTQRRNSLQKFSSFHPLKLKRPLMKEMKPKKLKPLLPKQALPLKPSPMLYLYLSAPSPLPPKLLKRSSWLSTALAKESPADSGDWWLGRGRAAPFCWCFTWGSYGW